MTMTTPRIFISNEAYITLLLNSATSALLENTVEAAEYIQEYRELRASGMPETLRFRCTFGVYRGSDECAEQLSKEIYSREA